MDGRPSLNKTEDSFSYPFSFYLVVACTFLLFFSMDLLITPLPLYIKEVGGRPSQIGLVMGMFAFTALLARPVVGRLMDTWGRKPLMMVGSVIFIVGPTMYALARSIPMLFLARMLHGMGIAAFTTASTVLVSELVPSPRRGEAIGLAGVASPLSLMLAPALGAVLLPRLDFSLLFLFSAVVATVSLLVVTPVREGAPVTDAREEGSFMDTASERAIWVPYLLGVTVGLSFGCIYTFLPLLGIERNIANVGLFFTGYGLTSITAQMPLGRLSDKIGRVAIIVPAGLLLALALGGLDVVRSGGLLIGVAILYGLGLSGTWTALTAMIVDQAGPDVRGTAVGFLSASIDLGVVVGTVAVGPVAETIGYGRMYLALGLITLTGVAVFVGLMRRQSPQWRMD